LTEFEADEEAFYRYQRKRDHQKMLKAAVTLKGREPSPHKSFI
jgi:hypothetical protein